MLEIIAIYLLANKNKSTVTSKGRKPGLYVALTIILWIVLEFIGAIIAAMLGIGSPMNYIIAILFALAGGGISYLIAKNAAPGDYVPLEVQRAQQVIQFAEPLNTPTLINIVRESGFAGAAIKWTFVLNGEDVATLANGASATVTADKRQNVMIAKSATGEMSAAFFFNLQNGANATITFKSGKFLPAKNVGVLPLDMLATPPVSVAPPQ